MLRPPIACALNKINLVHYRSKSSTAKAEGTEMRPEGEITATNVIAGTLPRRRKVKQMGRELKLAACPMAQRVYNINQGLRGHSQRPDKLAAYCNIKLYGNIISVRHLPTHPSH